MANKVGFIAHWDGSWVKCFISDFIEFVGLKRFYHEGHEDHEEVNLKTSRRFYHEGKEGTRRRKYQNTISIPIVISRKGCVFYPQYSFLLKKLF